MTVSETIEQVYARIGAKVNTYASYRDTFEPFKAIFGIRDCSEVLPAEIRTYLEGLKVKDSTRYVRFLHLNALFNTALASLRESRIPVSWENPCIAIRDGFRPVPASVSPMADTIHADMQSVEGKLRLKHRLIYELGTRAGLRIGEILKITPSCLARNGTSCWIMLMSPKSGKEQEVAVIPLDLCKQLHDYIEKAGIGTDERIFPMTRQAIYGVFKRKGIEPHDLRRYFAFRLVEKGKSLAVIRDLMRHSHVAVTDRYIGRLSVQRKADELEGM